MAKRVKKAVIKKEKKVVVKPYNSGTMTSSAFFSMIRASLRKSSRWWKPAQECKLKARRPYKGLKKQQRWEYQCNECKNWFMEKQISIDHKIECGPLNSFDDIPDFCRRLFVEVDGYQILCKTDHDAKTKAYREQLKLNKQENEIL
jgi:hypothetical protein